MTMHAVIAMLMASAWDNPVPGEAVVPVRNLLACGWRPNPVWRRRFKASPPQRASGRDTVTDLVAAHIARFDDQALIAQAHDWQLAARP